MKTVTIYTDGACSGNPGPGGFGVVLIYGDLRRELSGGFKLTTNNRMEILAVIEALKFLKQPCIVNLYSDSKYVVDAVQKGWLKKWEQNNRYRTKSQKASNIHLWQQLLKLLAIHKVNFIWVKGHNDNIENERCDYLAREFIKNGDLKIDANY